MPLDQAKIKEIKETMALARKRELNFGLCLGKKPEGMVLVTHKSKSPAAMGKEAKANGETKQFTFGTLSADGKDLKLVCEGKIYPGMGKKVREMLKAAGVSMKIHVLDPEGNASEAEEDADAEDQNQEQQEQAAATEAAPTAEETPAENTGAEAPPAEPPVIGTEPSKGDLNAEFAQVRQGLMRVMGQMEADARIAVQNQFKQFGDMMKSGNLKGAQELMDDMSAVQGIVTDPQRIRAREHVAQIDTYVGDIEAELDAIEAELNAREAAA